MTTVGHHLQYRFDSTQLDNENYMMQEFGTITSGTWSTLLYMAIVVVVTIWW